MPKSRKNWSILHTVHQSWGILTFNLKFHNMLPLMVAKLFKKFDYRLNISFAKIIFRLNEWTLCPNSWKVLPRINKYTNSINRTRTILNLRTNFITNCSPRNTFVLECDQIRIQHDNGPPIPEFEHKAQIRLEKTYRLQSISPSSAEWIIPLHRALFFPIYKRNLWTISA